MLVAMSGPRLHVPSLSDKFPLSIDAGGRYLNNALGDPFFLNGDAGWSLEAQCTQQQVDQYLDVRRAQGFNLVLFQCFEAKYTSQTPRWRNANGDDPFVGMTSTSIDFTAMVDAFFDNVELCVSKLAARGMVAVIAPAYFGFNNNSNGAGWAEAIAAESSGDLQTYGAAVATRFAPYGNVIWALGGDWAGDNTARDHQWNIAIGIRSVNPDAIICGHPMRTDGDGYSLWGPGGRNYTGWNLNTIYTDDEDVCSEAATAYGRSGPVPALGFEFRYDGEHGPMSVNGLVQQFWQVVLSGMCGHIFGSYPAWCFGDEWNSGTVDAQEAIDDYLDTPGTLAVAASAQAYMGYDWHLLEPKTDTSVITTSLGTGVSQICPARASDGSFALAFVNTGSTVTLQKSCVTHTPLNVRWRDPTNGNYTTPAEGSSHANSGTQTFAFPGSNAAGGNAWILEVA